VSLPLPRLGASIKDFKYSRAFPHLAAKTKHLVWAVANPTSNKNLTPPTKKPLDRHKNETT